MLDDSLRSIALLVEAHRRQRSLSPRTLNNLQRQCEAASVGSARLRKQFSRITLRAAGRPGHSTQLRGDTPQHPWRGREGTERLDAC